VRIAISFAAAVFASVVLCMAAAIGVFLVHERAEAAYQAEQGLEGHPGEHEENAAVVANMLLVVGLIAPVSAALAAGVGVWLARKALAPLREAADRARAARGAAQELLLPVGGVDAEWDRLANVVNELLVEERREMARTKSFTANAAHELRTPLTAMLGEVQVTLRRERSGEEYRQALTGIEAEVNRLAALVDRLLFLARADSGELRVVAEAFDLAQVAADVVASPRRPGKTVLVEGGPAPALGDRLLSRRVLANLVDNAVRHGGTNVRVRVARDGARATAAVIDDGPGLPAPVQARLFERFNRVPDGADGFGLGLAIAHALAVAQGGRLRLEGGPPTCFVLEMPSAE
jgi:two-component system heavy metal sensor histidine kinase CusS